MKTYCELVPTWEGGLHSFRGGGRALGHVNVEGWGKEWEPPLQVHCALAHCTSERFCPAM